MLPEDITIEAKTHAKSQEQIENKQQNQKTSPTVQ